MAFLSLSEFQIFTLVYGYMPMKIITFQHASAIHCAYHKRVSKITSAGLQILQTPHVQCYISFLKMSYGFCIFLSAFCTNQQYLNCL